MVAESIDEDFAERVFAQIRGFGEYGFPESHAASFAYIAYVTAWLKRHHPQAFTCGLLNAQPMGFYNISTIIEDAKGHQVVVLPIDVNHSDWNCTLEKRDEVLQVRMGLRFINGIGERERVLFERAKPPFQTIDDFIAKTGASHKAARLLAQAGAFASLDMLRRDALRATMASKRTRGQTLPLPSPALAGSCKPLRAEAVLWGHQVAHHSTHRHPMLALRGELSAMRIPTAKGVTDLPSGAGCHFVGLVICRQRPQTASGVSFFTLEDETGMVNLVIWSSSTAYWPKRPLFWASPAKIQRESGVVHLIVRRLWEFSSSAAMGPSRGRNL